MGGFQYPQLADGCLKTQQPPCLILIPWHEWKKGIHSKSICNLTKTQAVLSTLEDPVFWVQQLIQTMGTYTLTHQLGLLGAPDYLD
jgi:hypothetical protein